MSISTHTGMETYHRILQSARSEGKPVGPKHHEYNRQRREWEARQSNLKQLSYARERKKVKAQVSKAKEVIQAARDKLLAKSKTVRAEVDQETHLRELHHKLKMQKLAAGYQDNTGRTDYIKSKGNGL